MNKSLKDNRFSENNNGRATANTQREWEELTQSEISRRSTEGVTDLDGYIKTKIFLPLEHALHALKNRAEEISLHQSLADLKSFYEIGVRKIQEIPDTAFYNSSSTRAKFFYQWEEICHRTAHYINLPYDFSLFLAESHARESINHSIVQTQGFIKRGIFSVLADKAKAVFRILTDTGSNHKTPETQKTAPAVKKDWQRPSEAFKSDRPALLDLGKMPDRLKSVSKANPAPNVVNARQAKTVPQPAPGPAVKITQILRTGSVSYLPFRPTNPQARSTQQGIGPENKELETKSESDAPSDAPRESEKTNRPPIGIPLANFRDPSRSSMPLPLKARTSSPSKTQTAIAAAILSIAAIGGYQLIKSNSKTEATRSSSSSIPSTPNSAQSPKLSSAKIATISTPTAITKTPTAPIVNAPSATQITIISSAPTIDTSKITNPQLKEIVSGKITLSPDGKGYFSQIGGKFYYGASPQQVKNLNDLHHKINVGAYASYVKRFGHLSTDQLNTIRQNTNHPQHGILTTAIRYFGEPSNWSAKINGQNYEDKFAAECDYYEKNFESFDVASGKATGEFVDFGLAPKGNIHQEGVSGKPYQLKKDGKYLTYVADLIKARGLTNEKTVKSPATHPTSPKVTPTPNLENKTGILHLPTADNSSKANNPQLANLQHQFIKPSDKVDMSFLTKTRYPNAIELSSEYLEEQFSFGLRKTYQLDNGISVFEKLESDIKYCTSASENQKAAGLKVLAEMRASKGAWVEEWKWQEKGAKRITIKPQWLDRIDQAGQDVKRAPSNISEYGDIEVDLTDIEA